jgi:fructose 1,6-bisphosphatase
VDELHGLSLKECEAYKNTKSDSYIAGLSNVIPDTEKKFVFINLARCGNDIETMGIVMHEMMHHSLWLHNYDIDKEEEIITWAENESYMVVKTINSATYSTKRYNV